MRDRGAKPLVILVVVAAAAFLIWLFFIKDDGDGDEGREPRPASAEVSTGGQAVDAPQIVDEQSLEEFAGSVGHEVYWAGPIDGTELELTNTSDGRIYVRYLEDGAEPGDPRPAFLTVGTYPVPDAFEMLDEASTTDEGFTRLDLANGGLATYSESVPSSVHFAYPDTNYEIEVFDPSPERALELVTTGEVTPIG